MSPMLGEGDNRVKLRFQGWHLHHVQLTKLDKENVLKIILLAK